MPGVEERLTAQDGARGGDCRCIPIIDDMSVTGIRAGGACGEKACRCFLGSADDWCGWTLNEGNQVRQKQ